MTELEWYETKNFGGKNVFINRPNQIEQVAYDIYHNPNTGERTLKLKPKFNGMYVWQVAKMLYDAEQEMKEAIATIK